MKGKLPASAVGLRLARIDRKDELILCEAMRFESGRSAVDTVLRRAAITGHVEIGGAFSNHFADVLDEEGDIVERYRSTASPTAHSKLNGCAAGLIESFPPDAGRAALKDSR